MTRFAMRDATFVGTRARTDGGRPSVPSTMGARLTLADFVIFAALLIGFSLYDRQTSRMARNEPDGRHRYEDDTGTRTMRRSSQIGQLMIAIIARSRRPACIAG